MRKMNRKWNFWPSDPGDECRDDENYWLHCDQLRRPPGIDVCHWLRQCLEIR